MCVCVCVCVHVFTRETGASQADKTGERFKFEISDSVRYLPVCLDLHYVLAIQGRLGIKNGILHDCN